MEKLKMSCAIIFIIGILLGVIGWVQSWTGGNEIGSIVRMYVLYGISIVFITFSYLINQILNVIQEYFDYLLSKNENFFK